VAEGMIFEHVIGVDVGKEHVRAGVFDLEGTMIGQAGCELQSWLRKDGYEELSSLDIWTSVGRAVRQAIAEADIHPSSVVSIAFDAPSSLVVFDGSHTPLPVSPDGEAGQNVIAHTDRRAVDQVRRINATRHPVLKYFGGALTPEMVPPKLLWLKENSPQTWKKAWKFLDLTDYLVWEATGTDARNLCTATCRWAYDGKNGRWDATFFRKLGLEELLNREKMTGNIFPAGTAAGELTPAAARHLGLTSATKVVVGSVDTYAAGIALTGTGFTSTPKSAALEKVMALIFGPSSSHLAVSRSPHFAQGIRGPFKNAMIPGFWLNEGGQDATGSLIDFIIQATGRYDIITAEARGRGVTVFDYLNSVVDDTKQRDMEGPAIVKDLHVFPYFLGDPPPGTTPIGRGVISGLTLDDSISAVARLYYATLQAIAYGTRRILDEINKEGFAIKRIHACGRETGNTLLLQEYADITGCEIVLPREQDTALLGAGILAAAGGGRFTSIMDAAVRMSSVRQRYQPRKKLAGFHTAKYHVFRKMSDHIRSYEEIMRRF
jgi:FGGY-family pentulose kinase